MASSELFDTGYRRRIFFGSAIAGLVALVSLRFFVLHRFGGQTLPLPNILSSIIDNLLVALIASIAVTALVIWLTPPVMKTAVMEVVEPFRIRETLHQALDRTDEWWYRGHSGRHFRAVTLPQLAADARAGNVSKKVFLLILNPTRSETCSYYALYRQRLRSAKRDKPWTPERVLIELNVTIVVAYAWKAQEPSLDIVVALIDTVSLFRIDLSSRLALITKEEPQEPALRCDEGTFFYKSFREDLLSSLQQARVLPKDINGIPLEQLSIEGVKDLLNKLGLENQNLSDQAISEIITLAKKAENPYV